MGHDATERLRRELDRVAPSWARDRVSAARLFELLGLFISAAPDYLLLVSPEGTILYSNRARPGETLETIEGHSLAEDFFPELGSSVRVALETVARDARSCVTEGVVTYVDGSSHLFTARLAPIVEEEQVVAVVVAAIDITASPAAAAALRESEEKLRFTVAATGMGLWEWDIQTNVVRWDDAMCLIWGVTQQTFPRDYDAYMALVYPDDRASVAETIGHALKTGIYADLEHRIILPDGTLRHLLAKGTVTRNLDGTFAKVLGGCLDITNRRLQEEQQRNNQKLEAIGRLSAGIAHNFNNLLMAILPNLELAIDDVAGETKEILGAAQTAARRAAELVRQLTTFAGRSRPAPRSREDVAALIQQSIAKCRRAFEHQIECSLQLPTTPVYVHCDRGSLEQAIHNILVNARDALIDARTLAPRVQVEVSTISASTEELRRQGLAWATQGVRIQIADNGPGMDAATERRMYEPFFTTKDIGKGTGLGLSTSLAIVQDHGGLLECSSVLGKGTRFTIYLPASETLHVGSEPQVAEPSTARAAHLASILLVDDEAMVRQTVSRMLVRAGYRVHLAAGGQEALDLLRSQPLEHEIKLVLLDLSMPEMSGTEVRRAIRELWPKLPVAFLTGYAVDSIDSEDPVLEKPIGYVKLTNAVRELLAKPTSS